MSVIYDALKKVEGTPGPEPEKPRLPHPSKSYLLYLTVAGLGFLCAGLFYRSLAPNIKTTPTAALPVAPPAAKVSAPTTGVIPPPPMVIPLLKITTKTIPAAVDTGIQQGLKPAVTPREKVEEPVIPALNLNGIFFSGKDGYALINNRILKEGDTIEGLKLDKVTVDAVELTSERTKLRLSIQSR